MYLGANRPDVNAQPDQALEHAHKIMEIKNITHNPKMAASMGEDVYCPNLEILRVCLHTDHLSPLTGLALNKDTIHENNKAQEGTMKPHFIDFLKT